MRKDSFHEFTSTEGSSRQKPAGTCWHYLPNERADSRISIEKRSFVNFNRNLVKNTFISQTAGNGDACMHENHADVAIDKS